MANRTKRMVSIIKGNGEPIVSIKTGRNAQCPCGSGKKAKKCCGTDTKFFDSRPARVKAKEKEPPG